MRRTLVLIAVVTAASGCQAIALRDKTNDQAHTVNGLYYQQVVDNLAMHAANPQALPYFSYASTGTNQVQRAVTANYSLTWDLITSGAFLDRLLVDHQSSMIGGTQTDNDQWTSVPTFDPDKIQLMQFAYNRALGEPDSTPNQIKLKNIIDAPIPKGRADTAADKADRQEVERALPGFEHDYYERIHSGWFEVGMKCDVPKCACWVGHCGKTYVWVTPEHQEDLANLTLVILDIATLAAPGHGSTRQLPVATYSTTLP